MFQFSGNDDDAFFGVGFEMEFRRCALGGVPALLHFFVYQQEVFALARGKERRTKREAVDFALYAQTPARSPDSLDIKRNPSNHPAEIRAQALEGGSKRSLRGLGHVLSNSRGAVSAFYYDAPKMKSA